jgi:hypothetical protein
VVAKSTEFDATDHSRNMDLLQFVTINGREREVEDWKDLFKRGDERFHLGIPVN